MENKTKNPNYSAETHEKLINHALKNYDIDSACAVNDRALEWEWITEKQHDDALFMILRHVMENS